MAEVIGDGDRDVASQLEQHLQGSTGCSRKGIISAMCDGRVVEKKDETRNVTDLENLLPFYLSLNVAKYHNLNPHCGRL
jgi:hypothetical protein